MSSLCGGMSYPSDLTDDQWKLLELVFNAPGKRGRKHADDLRGVWMRCPTSRRPDASGATFRRRSVRGPGSGRWLVRAGRETLMGRQVVQARMTGAIFAVVGVLLLISGGFNVLH